jgi:serine/threonine protein kinase
MPLEPGSRLGPYEILAPLGAGGMGEVYRARDSSLKRDVAIKVLPAYWSRDPARLRRFEVEAQAAATLNHPNIVSIFHVGEHDGAPFIVTELLHGETLRDRLQRGPMPLREVLETGVNIARGLAAAHDAGIVHRDLKAEMMLRASFTCHIGPKPASRKSVRLVPGKSRLQLTSKLSVIRSEWQIRGNFLTQAIA